MAVTACLFPDNTNLGYPKIKPTNPSSLLLLDLLDLHEHITPVQATRCGRSAPNNSQALHLLPEALFQLWPFLRFDGV